MSLRKRGSRGTPAGSPCTASPLGRSGKSRRSSLAQDAAQAAKALMGADQDSVQQAMPIVRAQVSCPVNWLHSVREAQELRPSAAPCLRRECLVFKVFCFQGRAGTLRLLH